MRNDPRSKWLQYLLTLSVSMPALSLAAPGAPEGPIQISQGAAAQVDELSQQAGALQGNAGGEVDLTWPRAWSRAWPRAWSDAWADAWPQVIGQASDDLQPRSDFPSFGELLDAVKRA